MSQVWLAYLKVGLGRCFKDWLGRCYKKCSFKKQEPSENPKFSFLIWLLCSSYRNELVCQFSSIMHDSDVQKTSSTFSRPRLLSNLVNKTSCYNPTSISPIDFKFDQIFTVIRALSGCKTEDVSWWRQTVFPGTVKKWSKRAKNTSLNLQNEFSLILNSKIWRKG